MAQWPVFTRSSPMTHVGRLDCPPTAARFSLEGRGLSVSDHPEEWVCIARLDSEKTYALSKPEAQFIDMRALLLDEALMARVRDWALHEGLIEPKTLFRVSWFDDELDEEVSSLFSDKEEALAEMTDEGEPEKIDGFVATDRLTALQRQPKIDPLCVEDMIALSYAQYELKVDGAWWFESLDPIRLSAPRGVIFDHQDGWDIEFLGRLEDALDSTASPDSFD